MALRNMLGNDYRRPPLRYGLDLSPFQNPMSSPVSPIQSLTPLTAALAMPAFVPALFLPVLPYALDPPSIGEPYADATPGSCPGVTKLLPAPVAYSDPMLGNTFSPADSETNKAKGTSHTCRPKKAAISVKVGKSAFAAGL